MQKDGGFFELWLPESPDEIPESPDERFWSPLWEQIILFPYGAVLGRLKGLRSFSLHTLSPKLSTDHPSRVFKTKINK